jgi:hypothetical protein
MPPMVRQRSKNVPKMRMWGFPSTRKVATQVIPTKKSKLKKRASQKDILKKEIQELEQDD